MAFERWQGEDRWGLFCWEKRLYVAPIHPFDNILDGHRAEAIQWIPRAVGTEGFVPRDARVAPIAGPFNSRSEALEAANGRRTRERFQNACVRTSILNRVAGGGEL